MTKVFSEVQAIIRAGIVFSLAFGTFQLCQAAGHTVHLKPGANIQAAVNANPEGTTFILGPGNYYGQVIQPKDSDTITGEAGGSVYLVGAETLTFAPDPQGTGLFVADAPVINEQYGHCFAAFPLCGYPQDLYIHSVPQVVATSPLDLPAGSWYFDRVAGKVYIPNAPTSAVQIGVQPFAISSLATNVTISNLTVENYANLAQFGAIGDARTGSGWIVQNVHVRYNHGVGIKLGPAGQVLNSTIETNGDLGVTVTGANSKVDGNQVMFNNYAGFSNGWECGGVKFSETTDVVISNNNIHENVGPGIWADTDNVGALYESNLVWNNADTGIQHEMSYNAIIRNNTLYGNGAGTISWLWNGQISVQNSSDVQVYGNSAEVSTPGGNGIAIINQTRVAGPLGPHIAENNSVYNNSITYDLTSGKSGMVNDTGVLSVDNNAFYGNHYVLKQGSELDRHWAWFYWYDWPDFLSTTGQEKGATIVVDTTP